MIGAAVAIAFFESTEKALVRFVGEGGRDLTNRLHVGLGGNESAESGRAIGILAEIARAEPATAAAIESGAGVDEVMATSERFAAELARVVARFGHRAPAELELANPSWRADPAQLVDIVRIELHRPAHHDGAEGIRTAAEAELDERVRGPRRALVHFLLRRSRDLMAVRENGKVPAVRLFDDIRRLLGAIAPRLVAAGELPDEPAVHYLRYAELKGLLAGQPGPGPAELERRRAEHTRCLSLDLPELVEAGPGWLRPLDDALVVSRGLLPPTRVDVAADKLAGIGASPGRVVGTARVLLDPFGDFEPGDILFAKTVDPGWAPVLSCAGAVVLDMGGLLSHGAVVARELGIPCVVNVKAGTKLARSGSTVTVDGSAGEVLLA
jgi:pyruvate,water dikinase